MKRLFLVATALLLLSGIGVLVWTGVGLPPVRMVWSYGFSYHPEPTGEVLPIGDIELVEIGPGCFLMGSNQSAMGGDFLGRWCDRLGLPWGDQPTASNEMPVHWVEFPRGFWVAKAEVTNAQYEAFAPDHERSEYSSGDNDPVVDVSWEEAKRFCAWLSERSGKPIRLPSESEWECACRAASDREFCFGDDEKHLGEHAWFDANSALKAHEVGTRRANAWGLYDFHGNVWEWCEDAWHASYEGAPADGTAWSEGGEEWGPGTPIRVGRGGGFADEARFSRSAFRRRFVPGGRSWGLGIRLAYGPSDR